MKEIFFPLMNQSIKATVSIYSNTWLEIMARGIYNYHVYANTRFVCICVILLTQLTHKQTQEHKECPKVPSYFFF